MTATCQLCEVPSQLRESHIIPNWVFNDEIRDNAMGGQFIDLNKNRKRNKALTQYLLCESCEQLFSQWERPAREFSNQSVCGKVYGPWLLKFATSISWRVVKYFQTLREGELSPLNVHVLADPSLPHALQSWRQFLLTDRLDATKAHRQQLFVVSPDYHIRAAVGVSLNAVEGCTFVFSRFGFYCILGIIHTDNIRSLDASAIKVKSGSAPFVSTLPAKLLAGLVEIEREAVARAAAHFQQLREPL